MRPKIEIAIDPLETLRRCNGYYKCPKSPDGRRLGPLVAYVGTYDGPDGKKLHFVGDTYANFAMAEPHSNVLVHFAGCLRQKLIDEISFSRDNLVFCGAPIGGYDLARAMGFAFDAPVIKAEKKVILAGSASNKEESEIVFSRHNVEEGDEVILVEDVCNNFATAHSLLGNVILRKGRVIAFLCFLNRSLTIDRVYKHPGKFIRKDFQTVDVGELAVPVVSLVRMPIDEWRQDDPAVAEDVAKGNVVWNPKPEWDRLTQAMQAHA